jgi:hypothetical protein
MRGSAPPIHGQATATTAALVTVAIFVASLFGITLSGDVASALVTLLSVGTGYTYLQRKNGS